eukprot:212675_1
MSQQTEEHKSFPRAINSISYREYLSSTAFKDSLSSKLQELGLNENQFYHMTERELNNICDQIFAENELQSDCIKKKKIKFKASIKKLKTLWHNEFDQFDNYNEKESKKK